MRDYKKMVSIIVPVYNAQNYLNRCIDSLRIQTYENIEIIMVDDGSTDNSSSICDYYSKIDQRCVTYHRPNRGVSQARNIGLLKAKGEYVTFVDADDYVAPLHIEKLLEYCACDIDIVISDAKCFRENGMLIPKKNKFIKKPTVVEIDENYSFSDMYHHTVCWGALYRKSIIGSKKFDASLYLAEDSLFFAEILHDSQKICLIPDETYSYVYYDKSAAHGPFDMKKYTELDAWEKIVFIFSDKPDICKTCKYEYIKRSIDMYLQVYNSKHLTKVEKQKIMKEISARCAPYIKNGSVKYPTNKVKIRVMIFKYSPMCLKLINIVKGYLSLVHTSFRKL